MKPIRLLTHTLIFTLILGLTFPMTALASDDVPDNQRSIQSAQMDPQESASTASQLNENGPEEEDPLVCINSLTGVHLTAAALSLGLGFTPFKAAAIIADGAAHSANVGLKHCSPSLEAPPDLVIKPSSCAAVVEIPITRDALDQLVLDNQILELIVNDQTIDLPNDFRQDLIDALDSDFGYLSNETSGGYSNIYFIVNPLDATAIWPSNWGDLGVPELYHFNSDVQVVMRHPGNRISADKVQFPAGSHTVSWTADTLIAGADLVWIPDLSGVGAAKKKGQKEAAKKTWKQTIKGWYKAARDVAADTYTDIAKNQAKKTKKKLAAAGKKKLAKKAAKESIGFVLDSYFLQGYEHGKTTVKYQRIYVIDKNAPTITGNVPVTVEALEPGGVSSGNHLNSIRQQLNITDDCAAEPKVTSSTPRFWPLSLQADGSKIASEIQWTASDNGAVSASGGVNSTTVNQQVMVVDTKPPILVAPPPVIMEATASDVMTVSLGSAQVFDVADLRATISNDAPSTFTQGIYRINWQAEDFSGNVSEATKNTVQIVNLKEPGSNVLPTANELIGANAIDAISYEPITITVTGQDGDSTPDPLWFSIENQPQDGFFIAPLYPYFIDDFRMAARYSPWIAARDGEEVAWQVAQDGSAMHQYMKALCEEDIRRTDLPKDFVSGIDYVAVDDAGYTYIYDNAYRKCSPGGSTVAPYTTPRISVWDQEGIYFGELERSDSGHPLRSMKFNVGRGTIISTSSDSSSTGNSVVNLFNIQSGNAAEPVIEVQNYGLWNKINDVFVGADQTARGPQYRNAGAAAWDNTNGVLYVIGDPNQNQKGMAALKPAPCDGSSSNDGPEDCLDLLGVQIYSQSIASTTSWEEFRGVGVDAMRLPRIRDIALDSLGAVHLIAQEESSGNSWNRIYKFAPATVEPDGSVTLGEYIGWMGKCDSGPNCDYVNQRSIGYSCTAESCFIDEGGTISGDRAGQFKTPSTLAFDPNDVLYVADTGNSRVQRFSNDGLFAGEARSTGDGSGFVLGDFGSPSNIAVNQSSFYILDNQREIVHIFDAAVIHGIDESSAWVEYQSENNFVGTDRFTFAATDGFRNSDGETLSSPPATVEVNVTRNFRPPEATAGLAISVTEDTPTDLVLDGYDIDGELDTLTFDVSAPPADGTLSGTPPNLTYTPRQNFDDEDGFTFTVSDGTFTSEPEEFRIGVIPINDAPILSLDNERSNNFTAGVGFPFSIQGTVVDPEIDDELTITVDWGDGTIEVEGKAEDNGTFSGPVIDGTGVLTRTLLAYHTYDSGGTYDMKVTVADPSGATNVVNQSVTVDSMADLALQRKGSGSASPSRLTLSYELIAINLLATGGIAADGVTINESLGAGLTYRTAATSGGSCVTSSQTLECAINALEPDESASVRVVIDVDPSVAVGTDIDVQAMVSATTPDPVAENNDADRRIAILSSADFLVDSPIEGNDANPGDGLCATIEGACTLRAAVQEANAFPGKQSVALPRDTYMLNLDNATVLAAFLGAETAPSEDEAASGDLDITDDLDIIGLGAEETAINANAEDRVIDVRNGATVSIVGVSLSGGKPADTADSYGGGLRNVDGNVTLINVVVNANQSLGGGGIANRGGSMTIIASAIIGNDAGAGGGGGLLNESTLAMDNSTISGNRAGNGGGIQALGGPAVLRYVTITGNNAGAGGAINNSRGENLMLSNSIVAGNGGGFGPVCGFTLSSGGHNLFDDLQDCTILGETSSNIIDDSFSLENMTLNALSTYSHLPAEGSSVIDAGNCVSDITVDQRGVERPQGSSCDIGAVELIPGEVEVTVTPTATPMPTSTPTTTATPASTPTPNVTPTSQPTAAPDSFEGDDSCSAATTIAPDALPDYHTFHTEGDTDWVRFDGAADSVYRIEVQIPADSYADVTLELYTECGGESEGGGDNKLAPGIRIDFTPEQPGPVFLKMTNFDSARSGDDVGYQISVRTLQASTPVDSGGLIILTGRLRLSDRLQANIDNAAAEVYTLFKDFGYPDSHIQFLATDASLPGYDTAATAGSFEDSIVNWAKEKVGSEKMLTIYMIDHGDEDTFYIDEPNGERVTPDQLDGWLDQLEAAVPGIRINIFIEACNSGSFISGQSSISGTRRVIVTSTSAQNVAYASETGAHFSDHFFSALYQGHHIFGGYWEANESVKRIHQEQQPQVDGDGNGLPNEDADFLIASQRSFFTSSTPVESNVWPPFIEQFSELSSIGESQVTLRAEIRDDLPGIKAWAVIYPPSYQPPASSAEMVPETLEKVDLTLQSGDLFEGVYSNLSESGTYRIVVHAEDENGLRARPANLEFMVGEQIFLPFTAR